MDTRGSEEDVGKMECEHIRPDKTTSPAPPCTSLQSDQSMDQTKQLRDGTPSKGRTKRLRPDKTSPAPSCTSLQSDQSMDRPIVFKETTQNIRLRPDKTTSPALSCTSLQSDHSMDRPIVFKDRTQNIRLRPDKTTSPAPSYTSLQSDHSMDRPIVFKETTQNIRLRPDKTTSPAPSCTSLQSDHSMDRPIVFKDRTQNIRLRPDKTTSPAPSCTSLQSDHSMDRPIVFKETTQNIRLRPDKTTSPALSYTSLQSDHSMDRPIVFKETTQNIRLRQDKTTSPAPSCTSLQSDHSMDRPIVFKDRTQYTSIIKQNVKEAFGTHDLLRKEVLSPDISTLSATLLTEDHYRCSVCTEIFKNPVSIPCGHSYCKRCIEIYWSKPTQAECYACPQCRKRFRERPVLNVNVALARMMEELQQAGFSPALPAHCYAGPEDVSCDICTEMKLKAVKSCLTCCVSYCETHVRQHYTVPALQRHNLLQPCDTSSAEKEFQEEIKGLTATVIKLKSTLREKAKRLCKGFEVHCNDFPSDIIEVAALGRPLCLGMLYDAKSDYLSQTSFLWSDDTIASMRVSLPRPRTDVKVLEGDSLQDRSRALEMSPVLRTRALHGLIELSGAAAFLNHPVQSERQDRVTLHYKSTTRLDMISQTLLQEGAPPSVINTTTATHVIIAVCYGAQAFFVFDHWRNSSQKNAEMKNIIKKVSSSFCASHIDSSLNDKEKAMSLFYNCSLFIDVGDWKSPVSFDKAVEIYGSLPGLLGSKGERAVPLKVWLYPLKKLDKTPVCAALSGVSESLMIRAENVLEHLNKQIRKCQDFMTSPDNLSVITWFPALKDKFVEFLELLQKHQEDCQKGITEIAEDTQVKEEDEDKSLQHLLERHDQSPFSSENIYQWLENKETELKILNDCRAADITVVKSQAELQQVINHPQITRVMCLTLTSPDVEDSFLTALKQHIESDHIIPTDSLQFKPVRISQKVLIDLQLYIAAKETNEDTEQTKFIAASVPDDGFPEFSVQFYYDGRIVSRNMKFGVKPDLAHIVQIKQKSVSVKWNHLQKKSIERYVVEYRVVRDDRMNNNTWKQITVHTHTFKEKCVLSGLEPDTEYQLRYAVCDNTSMSNFSCIIYFKTSSVGRPGKPSVTKMSRDTLRITWLKAEADEDCPVLHYMVEYREAGLEGWSSVLTQGPQCECTLTHSTCYRVRVSAVYEDITSKPSEETSVPVDVWSIDLSEKKISILLEVLKLQTEKKPVELIDWSDEESEVRGFLQCLPYISQLRFEENVFDEQRKMAAVQFLMKLIVAASECESNTENNYTELLTSMCSYTTFPSNEAVDKEYLTKQSHFLLDLWSHVKDYETQTGRSVLPALQPIYQSSPAVWSIKLSERKISILLEVLKLQTEKKPVELIDWSDEESEVRGFLQCLPYISQLSFYTDVLYFEKEKRSAFQFLLNLSVTASEWASSGGENFTEHLTSVCSYTSLPCDENINYYIDQCDFLLDLWSYVKDYETQTGRSVLPALQPIYQSSPAVWTIKLSERKSSILLEVLKLQTEKKPVDLIDWSDEESEVRGFLQCLPYISQLRVSPPQNQEESFKDWEKRKRLSLLNLCLQAALCQEETLETYMDSLFSSVHDGKCDFLLDLWSHVKDYETQTGRSVLPALQPIYQSSPAVWSIKLSERKISILLEVLKLQTEKKPVELIDWSDEESEVRGFLQCLPYISQLRFNKPSNKSSELWEERKRLFILDLCLQAALCQKETIETTVKMLLSSVNYEKWDFLLNLCSHVKDYETQTGRSVLPALQPIYQSSPAVWTIKLSERKISILLEVLKLQTEKKPVELIDWSDEESEVRGFLQCLPYISQLSFYKDVLHCEKKRSAFQFLLNLSVTASEWASAARENFTEHLTSVCSYTSFPCDENINYYIDQCDFLLDLWSHVKDYETQTGRSVLPALRPFYQSSPAVWTIELSERKISILLEVLKLQTEKKPVELIDWSDEESELRGFLQCLPYISQLSFYKDVLYDQKEKRSAFQFLLNLSVTASEWASAAGENFTEHLTSVCSYTSFPCDENINYYIDQCDFLLDLWSHVKDYETQTGRSVLPALQPIYQSSPAVWTIKLSERKISILLEVLKLQTEKKPVELIGWSDEESEVRGFLQCLPYISQLRFNKPPNKSSELWEERKRLFILDLCLQAALCQKETIETTVKMLLSSVNYEKSDFLLDLCSHVKNYETQTGRSVLPALQPIYQSSPAVWTIKLSERKISILLEVLKLQTEKKPVELIDWSDEESEVRGFLQCLPYISQLRFPLMQNESSEKRERLLALNLCLQVSPLLREITETCMESLFSYIYYGSCDFLLDLWSHVKDYETQTGRSVLPALQPIYQSSPAVWSIKLSERKISILLEVLKLQTEKKTVELIDWSDEESEVRGFLQCLPYISQLRFCLMQSESFEKRERGKRLLAFNLFLQVSSLLKEITETCMESLFSYIYYGNCEFLLDLWLHVKNYETQTGRSVLPALQPIYQSSPAVWTIKLSERKISILLEVLKLQTEKKPVELIDWSDEESEVRGFLQCLPYISQLRFNKPPNESSKLWEERKRLFILDLCLQAALCQKETKETTVKMLLSSVNYEKSDFLLDLCSHVKNYETQTGRSVLPALQPIYQSSPAVWTIKLSERKISILLEVLKLQTEKKPVDLLDWSDEESEVRGFLQCLPYISQLRFTDVFYEKRESVVQFLVNLFTAASECDTNTGENYTELLTSVCSYTTFPFKEKCCHDFYFSCVQSDFLLDLYSHVKDYETQTGRSVLPALQPIYQSSPAVWTIKLSERKSSILLEVLKLQTEKKPVELIDWSDEESEVRGFLQCLPYISQLRFTDVFYEKRESVAQFLVNLFTAASECDTNTGENYTELLTSVCSYTTFPCNEDYYYYDDEIKRWNFLLDLCSHVKDYETQTGRSVLPALQPIYQSSPAVWTIKLSERKISILLEVLKLQTEKKPVELIDWSDEESEVRGFLQCLLYISQLRFHPSSCERASTKCFQFLVNLFTAASECDTNTGENYTELLTSVCSYTTFPCDEHYYDEHYYTFEQSDFLLDLCSHVKDYETQTGRSVLPALQPIYQSSPAVWTIELLERKISILLEVLKLQTEKKPVDLLDWSDEESEVRGFLQCLPYISQLRFHPFFCERASTKCFQFLVNLFTAASECDTNTGENYTELLTSVCSYTTFPSEERNFHGFRFNPIQSDFLLDLWSHVKHYETQTGRSVLPALQPIYQSSPAIWSIKLSERKISILLEVLKLQTEKKPVDLLDWSDEESEVRGFLQCLPYISVLRNADQCIPSLCKVFGPKVKRDQVSPLLQALGFTVTLSGKLPSSTCRCVGRVLSLSPSKLNLTLKTQAISLRGVRLLFKHITHLQKLSLEDRMVVKMVRALRSFKGRSSLTTEELSLVTKGSNQNLCRTVSSLTSLLRRLSVQCLDLTEFKTEAVTGLLCLQGFQTIRFSKETLQQLLSVVYEAQDDGLTRCFLEKVSEDLTFCSLNWEVIQYLLKHQDLHLKLDFRKSKISCENIRELLPWLDRIQLKRLSPSFILSIMMEINESRSPQYVSSLLRSAENYINLRNRVLDSVHCAALRFTLEHCNTVRLDLFWTSIPEEELESFLPLLNRVTQLSVDRQLLLKLLHCCSSSDDQQEAAAALLSALQNRLDFSCCSSLDLTVTQDNQNLLNLTAKDCRIISSVLQKTQSVVKLVLEDCKVSDSALKKLLPILSQVQLSCSKALLLQFLAYINEDTQKGSVRWAQALSQALGGEVDLSHTQMDQRACEHLALFLEYSDGLTELDLSHCKLTDQYMNPLMPHLHKTQTLDLSHNNITDELAKRIYSVVSTHNNIHTVRLFGNRIRDKKQFITDKRIEIW